jgi:predicted enzyme related to lactoylglutathione lyase
VLADRSIVAFAPTTDLARAHAFYHGVLGLALTDDDGFALVFDANGTTVRITKVDDLQPQPFTILGWEVHDIGWIALELQAAGVPLLRFDGMQHDDLGIWTSPGGSRVAWFRDPDGNTLSLTEHRAAS